MTLFFMEKGFDDDDYFSTCIYSLGEKHQI